MPLNYNDGSQIEQDKFELTAVELCDRFGGVTQDMIRVTGSWKYGGTRYRDELFRIRIDSDDPSASMYLRFAKRTWKERFQQIDIWITAHEIEII